MCNCDEAEKEIRREREWQNPDLDFTAFAFLHTQSYPARFPDYL